MSQNVKMLAKDTLSAALAECFITIGTRRYNFMQAINVEAKFEKTKTEVPILGKTGKGITGMTTKEDDFVKQIFTASTHDTILFFTNKGKLYKLKEWLRWLQL